jgi:acetoin utilization protein AcuB
MTRVVDDYMKPMTHVLAPSATIEEAKGMIEANGVRHLPVVTDGQVLGIVTLSDLFVHTALLGTDDTTRVADVMSRELYTVESGAALGPVAREMSRRRVGSAIVLSQGKAAGVFTATDALRALADALGAS